MFAVIAGIVLALFFLGLPLGIIGLFVVSVIDQKSTSASRRDRKLTAIGQTISCQISGTTSANSNNKTPGTTHCLAQSRRKAVHEYAGRRKIGTGRGGDHQFIEPAVEKRDYMTAEIIRLINPAS